AWQRVPQAMDDPERVVALRHRVYDHANCELVVDLADVRASIAHLVINAEEVLGTPKDLGVDVVLCQHVLKGVDRLHDVPLALDATLLHTSRDLLVFLGLEVAERQVLELPFDLPDAES